MEEVIPEEAHHEQAIDFTPERVDVFKESIRKNFIRKVFSIVALQILINVAFCGIALLVEPFAKFQKDYSILIIICGVAAIFIFKMLIKNQQLAQKYPANYILLGICTVCISYFLSSLFMAFKNNGFIILCLLTVLTMMFLIGYTIMFNNEITHSKGMFASVIPGLIFLVFFSKNSQVTTLEIIGAFIISVVFGLSIIAERKDMEGMLYIDANPDQYIQGVLLLYLKVFEVCLKVVHSIYQQKVAHFMNGFSTIFS
jgi:hypothetical protein